MLGAWAIPGLLLLDIIGQFNEVSVLVTAPGEGVFTLCSALTSPCVFNLHLPHQLLL